MLERDPIGPFDSIEQAKRALERDFGNWITAYPIEGNRTLVVAPQQTFQSCGTLRQQIGAGEQAQSTSKVLFPGRPMAFSNPAPEPKRFSLGL
jgi:hypothetical protein